MFVGTNPVGVAIGNFLVVAALIAIFSMFQYFISAKGKTIKGIIMPVLSVLFSILVNSSEWSTLSFILLNLITVLFIVIYFVTSRKNA